MALMNRMVVLGVAYLATHAAASAAAAAADRGGGGRGGFEDSLALVQHRAQPEHGPRSLAAILNESFSSRPEAYAEIADEVISHVGEKRLQEFFAKVVEIGQAPNMSRGERGLAMVQEAGRVIGMEDGPINWATGKYAKWSEGKSEPSACGVSWLGIFADLGDLSIAIAYPIGKTCSKPALCLASGFDILRALVYTIREVVSNRYSYCAESVDTKALCFASTAGVFAELTGVTHSSISLSYKCDAGSYKESDSASKIFGSKIAARGFMCGWDAGRGLAYFLLGIYRAFWYFYLGGSSEIYVDDQGKLVRKLRGVEEIGQSGVAYGLMAMGGFAWVANAITSLWAGCPDDSGSSDSRNAACGKEVAELTAYMFQSLAYMQNFRDYCRDVYGKNDVRSQAGNEDDFRLQVQNQWNEMKKYVPKELTPEDIRILIEKYFTDEAADVLEDELEVSMNTPARRASVAPDELTKDLERAIDIGLVPHGNPRVSIIGGPRPSQVISEELNKDLEDAIDVGLSPKSRRSNAPPAPLETIVENDEDMSDMPPFDPSVFKPRDSTRL